MARYFAVVLAKRVFLLVIGIHEVFFVLWIVDLECVYGCMEGMDYGGYLDGDCYG